ncbi:uncharacterized protein EKO05_0001935 [Ascochyta rabiei]|uniref:Uncharacterized protein n=1 Tax=Didymella rabiei TaxID=5454 RepID=A0A163I0K3_DIDRA|nr:uncharacterized protein EKO05_0001935 [Ascochyta rabiei]KZM25550.1 hypothetical protein ST47_g3316 [Ascochyta rabiei]UPX11327.1 hypothetical protein EKO05_0001935 [Ascochyta rabiei]
MAELAVFDKDPNIYLFTSLTAGSSHIVTATSRIETILKANKIPFIGLDTATHELGRKLFQRRASGKKLPLLVKEGYVLGGIEEIEEWNEYDELREALGVDSQFTANPPKPTSLFEPAPSKTPPPLAGALPGGFSFGSFGGMAKENAPVASSEQNLAIRQMGTEAAKLAASKKPAPVKISTTNPLLTEKTNAKSPADILSPKSTPLPKSPNTATTGKDESEAKKLPPAELPDILSPRSIPLPQTPGAAPKLGQQKPVHAPPRMHDDAANPALSAGPTKTTQKKEESSEEEDDDDSDDGEESSETDTTAKKKKEKTQDQDPKDASRAGASVKEGEQEKQSSEDDNSSSAEADAEKEENKAESKTPEAKEIAHKPQPKQKSSEGTSSDEEEESDEKEVKSEEPKKAEVKQTQAQDAKDASKAGESVLD